MDKAGKIFSQHPDPEGNLVDLKEMELGGLKVLLNRYTNIVRNRALLGRLRDGGESARRALFSVQTELQLRTDAGAASPLAVDHRTHQLAQMEFSAAGRGGRPGWASEPLDSDDEPDPAPVQDEAPEAPSADCVTCSGDTPVGPSAVTRHLLPKSATSQRHTRFATNRPRPPASAATDAVAPRWPKPASDASRSLPRAGIVSLWADSALAAPDRPELQTRLLDMQESLQLLSQHDQQVQEERLRQTLLRFAPRSTGDGPMDAYGMSDSDGEHKREAPDAAGVVAEDVDLG